MKYIWYRYDFMIFYGIFSFFFSLYLKRREEKWIELIEYWEFIAAVIFNFVYAYISLQKYM